MKHKIFLLIIFILSINTVSVYASDYDVKKELNTLTVNNNEISIYSYNIGEEKYFMLRDIACILNGTGKQFNIEWDCEKCYISIIPSSPYMQVGSESRAANTDENITIFPALQRVYYDNKELDITAYEINGSNHFRIEDIMQLLDISLVFDDNNEITGIDTSMQYDMQKHNFLPQSNVSILLYHDIISEGLPDKSKYDVLVTKEKFENDIANLISAGYQSLSLENYYLNKYDKNKKYFILTFDDGYLSNYKIAYPIIKQYNIFADIFINTDNVFMTHHFNLDQAKEMEDSELVKIYSHYPIHTDVRDAEPAEYTAMLDKSIHTLEEVLVKKPFYFFAYPYSYYNEDTYNLTREANFKLQVVQNAVFLKKDIIVRYNVSQDTDVIKLIE